MTGLALLLVIAACLGQGQALKLKVRYEECMTYEFQIYEPFYGSYVSLADQYGAVANYDVTITSPSGQIVHEVHSQSEAKFHQVPYESGRYKFCLRLSSGASSRYVLSRDVVWDVHIGHAETHDAEHVKESDTQSLWHYVNMVDAQLQQLRSTQQYLYWRERRHRLTAESTNKRVMFYALLRSGALVGVAIFNVVMIKRLFKKR